MRLVFVVFCLPVAFNLVTDLPLLAVAHTKTCFMISMFESTYDIQSYAALKRSAKNREMWRQTLPSIGKGNKNVTISFVSDAARLVATFGL